MFKYKITAFGDAGVIEFDSRYHIAMMQAETIANANISFVYFEDAEIAVNLAQVKCIEIDGKKYLLKPYMI